LRPDDFGRDEESGVVPKCLRSGAFLHGSCRVSFYPTTILDFFRKLFSRAPVLAHMGTGFPRRREIQYGVIPSPFSGRGIQRKP
jgi:hypothetical protein